MCIYAWSYVHEHSCVRLVESRLDHVILFMRTALRGPAINREPSFPAPSLLPSPSLHPASPSSPPSSPPFLPPPSSTRCRYIVFLMRMFSIYIGLTYMYNDVCSKSLNIFGSSWDASYTNAPLDPVPGEWEEGMHTAACTLTLCLGSGEWEEGMHTAACTLTLSLGSG